MNERSEYLLGLAKRIVIELNFQNIRFATVGGSVGRGDADLFSDLDLHVYVGGGSQAYEKNLAYEGEIIQLYVIDEFPTMEQVHDNPWEYRFIKETIAVYDPAYEFTTFKQSVDKYFSSEIGKERLFLGASNIVDQRKQAALNSIKQGKQHSAKIFAGAAWSDSSFLYTYFTHGSLSTGSLIPIMMNEENELFQKYIKICPFPLELLNSGMASVLRIVERYREYLRSNTLQPDSFSLSPLQDVLIQRKAQRLYEVKQYTDIVWQLTGEIFMLYLDHSEGLSFEDYIETLPKMLQSDLNNIGFTRIDEEQVICICNICDDIVKKAFSRSQPYLMISSPLAVALGFLCIHLLAQPHGPHIVMLPFC